jgi:hypothetical protein
MHRQMTPIAIRGIGVLLARILHQAAEVDVAV